MTAPTMKFDVLLLPGMDRAVGHARRWLRDVLGEHPVLDDASLCMSELVANALRYTDSGRNGQIRVEVSHSDQIVRIDVVDDGGASTVPRVKQPDETDICGRGLRIVSYMSTEWGVGRRGKGHVVWFEMSRVLGD